MVFVDPLFQACMIEVVRASGDLFGGKNWEGSSYETELQKLPLKDPNAWRGLPVIFDEGERLLSVSAQVLIAQYSLVSIASAIIPPLPF
jgi:hypothetical protein